MTVVLRLFVTLLLFFAPLIVFGQQKSVSGKVTNAQAEALPFVSVGVKGKKVATKTDFDGKYQLNDVNEGDTLSFFFVGFKRYETVVAGTAIIDVQLVSEARNLNEVVVVGYGQVSSKELTGATARVKGDDVEKMNVSRMDQALQGQVSGVTINTNSGSPGGSSNIRIRGLSTFGDNDPLILVDGVVYDSEGLNALNPADIKSVNVLKDATAGIYGVRAANGVIIVETKQGRLNAKPKVEYNGYYGIQSTSRKLDLLNAREYAVIKNEMFALGGQPMPFPNAELGEGTNWQDSVFTNSPIQSHNLSLSGGTASSRYSVGLGYFDQQGIVGGEKSSFSRYNARLNLETDMSSKLQLNSVFLYSNDARSTLPENGIGSVLYNTINAFPNEPVHTPNGNYSYLEEVSDIVNPLALINNTYNWSIADKFVGKEELVAKFDEHFTWTNRFNYNYAQVKSKVFSPLAWYGDGKYANTAINEELESPTVEIADGVLIERGAAVYEERSSFTDLTFESFLNYDQVFDSIHRVKGTLGVTVFQRKGESLNGIAYNIPNNSVDFADISANTAEGGYLNNTGSWEFTERLLSAFLRAEYSFRYKYLLSVIVRRDGSSKFGSNSRYGWFPTVSAAWLISDEKFFPWDWMDLCKLRVSYGVSGNDQIPNFAYRALLNGEGVYVFDDVITQGVAIGRPANPDLKWETTRQFNVGLDLTVFKNLDFTANYFIKNTFDLLFQPEVTAVLGSYGPGGYPPIINAGDVSNKGVELELGYSTRKDRNFVASVNVNYSKINNKVTGVPEGVDYIPGASFGVGGDVATRFQEGYEIGYFFGYQMDGIYQTQEEIDNAPAVQEGAKPGDIRFVDQNGDGVINFNDDSDKTNLGSPIPDFTMGLAINLKYKSFDLSTNIYAAIGQEIIRNFERQQPYANQMGYVIDRWTGPGSTNEHPRLTTEPTRNNIFSSYFVEDGSFIRMKNVQLGYTLSPRWSKKIKLDKLRIYVAVNNLVTLTKYQGYDPDIGSSGVLSAGVDYGFYPQARTYMAGLQISL